MEQKYPTCGTEWTGFHVLQMYAVLSIEYNSKATSVGNGEQFFFQHYQIQ